MITPRPRISAAVATPMQAAGGIEKRATGETVVHGRSRADDLVDGAAASRRKRASDDRHDAGAGGHRVAPGAGNSERDVPDASRLSAAGVRPRPLRPGTRSAARLVAGSQPASSASNRLAFVDAHLQAILATERAHGGDDDPVAVDHPTRRPAASPYLNNRGRRRGNNVCQLVRKFSQHESIVAETTRTCITRTGGLQQQHFDAMRVYRSVAG